MKQEIRQPSTEKKLKTKRKSPDFNDESMIYSFNSIPVSRAKVERMIEELKTWVERNPKAKTITQFYKKQGLITSTYYSLLKRHEDLKAAHDSALEDLGERLWGDAVDRRVDWKPVHFRLYNYSPELKADYEYHAALQAKNAQDNETKIVVIERFPETAIVPVKVSDRE